jgi:hypothetical protein
VDAEKWLKGEGPALDLDQDREGCVMSKKWRTLVPAFAALAIGGLVAAGDAQAADTLFQQYVGDYGVSTSGWGSTSSGGTISTESIAAGSTVVAAYLYSSTYSFSGAPSVAGGTLGGSAVNYSTALGVNSSACCDLQGYRADVTSIVAPVINGGVGGVYNFGITETNSSTQDGEALVIVYSNSARSTQTVGILNGFASSAGDTSTISFGTPLNPSDPGFFAHMIIGDGFSCCDQQSNISVDGNLMTTAAGNNDSSVDGGVSNGNLITVGNMSGPYTGGTPGFPQTCYTCDHEAYDLASFIPNGSSVITINTQNASLDDNIFLEAFDVSGVGNISTGTPEPSTWAMMLLGFVGLGFTYGRTKKAAAFAA